MIWRFWGVPLRGIQHLAQGSIMSLQEDTDLCYCESKRDRRWATKEFPKLI